ncbi:hypothetical protein DVR12_08435 [Chitinophaga silvatica]|uniref:Uncharacterized protein n=1 Tax=Chitinophaga silvatica TaxID=2282649 RepID=A0A3E1YCC6_9BACT|nr:hypothetical protein [Chitinophaga silvatica]RFS23905.1 hypothetical protein DVR12_08435 [Chitinophaga silvatica]
MQLQPGTCYKIASRFLPSLNQFGEFEFVVSILHANDTSNSIVFEFRKIIGASSIEQEIATRLAVETHADGIVIQDISGKNLNIKPFDDEKAFEQWIKAGAATPYPCYS